MNFFLYSAIFKPNIMNNYEVFFVILPNQRYSKITVLPSVNISKSSVIFY